MDTKNDMAKMKKFRSLKCLSEIIPNHVQSGTKLHRYLLLNDSISDKIIPGVDVSFPLAT